MEGLWRVCGGCCEGVVEGLWCRFEDAQSGRQMNIKCPTSPCVYLRGAPGPPGASR